MIKSRSYKKLKTKIRKPKGMATEFSIEVTIPLPITPQSKEKETVKKTYRNTIYPGGKYGLHVAQTEYEVLNLIRDPLVRECIDWDDALGYTPLHHHCITGNYNIVKILLQYGASPYSIDRVDGTMPLISAKTDQIFDLLLEYGTNPNVLIQGLKEGKYTYSNLTPYSYYAIHGNSYRSLRLLQHGAIPV